VNDKHFGKIMVCENPNCKNQICTNCAVPSQVHKGKSICELCKVNELMDSDDDEGMDFGGPTKFTTVFSLKFDWENGG